MRICLAGIVQKGIGEAYVFLLTSASWAELNGLVYYRQLIDKPTVVVYTSFILLVTCLSFVHGLCYCSTQLDLSQQLERLV